MKTIGARLLLLISLLASCAATPPEQPSSETLLLEPPEGWELVYQFNNFRTRLSEFVPPGQTVSEWAIKLTLESHADLIQTDPIDILIAEVKRLEETCTFVQHFNLSTGLENQYPTSVRLVFCGENRATDSGEISIMKAIQGNDFLYLLRLNKRVAAFEDASSEVNQQEVGSWSSYLSRIKLCDASREEHPCPDAD